MCPHMPFQQRRPIERLQAHVARQHILRIDPLNTLCICTFLEHQVCSFVQLGEVIVETGEELEVYDAEDFVWFLVG